MKNDEQIRDGELHCSVPSPETVVKLAKGNSDLRAGLLAELAAVLGISECAVRERISRAWTPQEFFSIPELAERWRCSRGTVYNRLRASGASILDFAPRGRKGKKIVASKIVRHIEQRWTKRLW
jgi:biotin operon repressor